MEFALTFTNDDIGPLALFRRFRDDWLVTKEASWFFFLAALLTLALTPVFLGRVDTTRMSFWHRLPWGLLGVIGPVALFFLWMGMGRYWFRLDRSQPWVKKVWLAVLVFGIWYGACAYYFFAYLPQIRQRTKAGNLKAAEKNT